MNEFLEFDSSPELMEEFKHSSLKTLAEALRAGPYPEYPTERLICEALPARRPLDLPDGPWNTKFTEPPSLEERNALEALGLEFDADGRPLHPWFEDMVTNPALGVVLGQGEYWWGPYNDTADSIIIRRDLSEPHIVLIKRGDIGARAIPGGYKTKSESGLESDLDAAIRETHEETGIDLTKLQYRIIPVYKGPVADLRMTAHAWPVTAAFCFELLLETKEDRKALIEMTANNRRQRLARSLGRFAFAEGLNRLPWEGGDDAAAAAWVPASRLDNFHMFGSHRQLIDLALRSAA